MTDAVIRPVSSGLGPNLKANLQQTGDGLTDAGPGLNAARRMTGGGAQDASTAGGLQPDQPGKFAAAGIPDPLRSLLVKQSQSDHGMVR